MPGGVPPVWGGGESFDTIAAEPGAHAWETVGLGAEANPPPLPGVAKVTVVRARKIDDRSGPGRNGARLIDKGAEAGKVRIRLRIWTDDQLDELTDRMPSLDYTRERLARVRAATAAEIQAEADSLNAVTRGLPAMGLSGALGAAPNVAPSRTRRETVSRLDRAPQNIIHPATILAGISQVYVEKTEIGELEDGVLTISIECLEFKPEYTRRSISLSPSRPRQTASIADIQTTAVFRPNNRNAGP